MRTSSKLKRILNKLTLRNSAKTQKLLKDQALKLNGEKRIELAEKDRQIKQLKAGHQKEIRTVEKYYNLKHLELDRLIQSNANKSQGLSSKHDQLDEILADSNTYLAHVKSEAYQKNVVNAKLADLENSKYYLKTRADSHKKSMRQ
jgi:hypothetical protein